MQAAVEEDDDERHHRDALDLLHRERVAERLDRRREDPGHRQEDRRRSGARRAPRAGPEHGEEEAGRDEEDDEPEVRDLAHEDGIYGAARGRPCLQSPYSVLTPDPRAIPILPVEQCGRSSSSCARSPRRSLSSARPPPRRANGELSLERGRGSAVLEMRGVVLGRLTSGTLRVTDLTPRDRFAETVVRAQGDVRAVGPRTVLYRGQGIRFKLLGGRYRIVIRGTGMSVSAVGRGEVVLDGDPRWLGDDVGVFSLDGVDCVMAPQLCLPVPTEPERYELGSDEEATGKGVR